MIRKLLLFIFGAVLVSSSAFADTIYLKNGKKVSGEILSESGYSVKIRTNGVPYTYYVNEIDRIEKEDAAKRVSPEAEKKEQRSLAEIPESKKDLILRLLEANGAKASMAQIFSKILAEAPEETREELKKLLVQDEIILRLVPVYDVYYNEEELKDLILFYKSPVGSKQLEITPKIMEATMAEMANYFKEKVSAGQEKKN